MSMHRGRISSALLAAIVVASLTVTACGTEEDSTPAPTGQTTTEETQQQESPGRGERADLVRFELDDRSQAGLTDIWVVWTIKNNSSEKSDYSWDWEAVDASGTRVDNSTELATSVQPGQTATGESPTMLNTTEGIKLNITSFDRTAGF